MGAERDEDVRARSEVRTYGRRPGRGRTGAERGEIRDPPKKVDETRCNQAACL